MQRVPAHTGYSAPKPAFHSPENLVERCWRSGQQDRAIESLGMTRSVCVKKEVRAAGQDEIGQSCPIGIVQIFAIVYPISVADRAEDCQTCVHIQGDHGWWREG